MTEDFTYGPITRTPSRWKDRTLEMGVQGNLLAINDMVDMAKHDNGRYNIRIVSSKEYDAIRQERLCAAYPDRGWMRFHIGNHADRMTPAQERCRIRDLHHHGHMILQDQSEVEVCL